MSSTVRDLFNSLHPDLVFDEKLLKKVNAFRIGFMVRNEDHIKFFGGNLTGVEVVRFTTRDDDYWCDEILGTSYLVLESELLKLPVIIPSFKVSSNPINNSFVWMMHKFMNSPHLNERQRIMGAFEVAMVMNYRYITSRIWNHFRFPADPEVAEATYASLSRKFALKQHGTWNKTLENRSRDIIDQKTSIWKSVIMNMNNDIKVREMLNDTQGRIRSMIKIIFDRHLLINSTGARVVSSSSVVEHDGAEILKDRVGGYASYYRYILDIISDKNSFIKPVLVRVISKAMNTMPTSQFEKTLDWLTTNSHNAKFQSKIEKLITDIIIHAFNYLYDRRNEIANTNDIVGALSRLKGAYSAPRSTEPLLLSIRKETEQLVEQATNTRHKGNIAAVRTGVLLYIVARAMTRSHFTN